MSIVLRPDGALSPRLANVIARTRTVAETVPPAAEPHPLAILLDVSSSMGESAGTGTKAELVNRAVLDWLKTNTAPDTPRIAFSTVPTLLATGARLPQPDGSTALHLAIDRARTIERGVAGLLVISDGHPDDGSAALSAAAQLGVPISTLHVGPDDDHVGKSFLKQLADATGGQSSAHDIARHPQLSQLPALLTQVKP